MANKSQPYVGPRPFEKADQSSFFGRDREARSLLSYVFAHEAVLLYAQSGAGKTSLLNAKLIPLLEEKGFEVLPAARVRGPIPEGMEPDQIPNLYVFNTLIGWAGDEFQPEDLAQMSLTEFLSAGEHPEDEEETPLTRRVIIFDQFEELFSFYPERWEEREDFFRQVSEALRADPLLRVLFVMREDYLASVAPYAKLIPEQLRTRYRLERLRAEAAQQAVEGPLQDTGRSFTQGVAASLVQELLNMKVEGATGETVEVPGEYVEPVQLQVVCQSLWLNLPPDATAITAYHLQSFGDVEEALRDFYERAIETAATEGNVSKDDLRKWFNEQLITPVGTRGTVFRGNEDTGGISNSAVDILEDQHIIRAEVRSGARWYELTHDRLIEPIHKANEAWHEKEQERKIEAEGQRTQEQRQRADEQARIAKRFRILTAAMVVLFLAAIAASVFAFYQRQEAKEQAMMAESQRQEVGKLLAERIAEKDRLEEEEKRILREKGIPFDISVYSGSRYKTRFYVYYIHPATKKREYKTSGNIPRRRTGQVDGSVHLDYADKIHVVVQRYKVLKWRNIGDFYVKPPVGQILFKMELALQENLENGNFSKQLRKQFTAKNITLPQNVTIRAKEVQDMWEIHDEGGIILYIIKKEDDSLNTYIGRRHYRY